MQAELQKAQLGYAHASHMEQLRLSADVERQKLLVANRLIAVGGAVGGVVVVCVAALAALQIVAEEGQCPAHPPKWQTASHASVQNSGF